MSVNPLLYPHITSLPSQDGVSPADKALKKTPGAVSEFDQVLDRTELDHIKAPLKFSAHATQRLRERQISLDPSMLAKIQEAVDKAEAKGVEDTLILTPQAALIVNVSNRTVVTALDRKAASGNVFTNIDGAVVVS